MKINKDLGITIDIFYPNDTEYSYVRSLCPSGLIKGILVGDLTTSEKKEVMIKVGSGRVRENDVTFLARDP